MSPAKLELTKDVPDLGCCGAFCGTCPVMKEMLCKGCKLGYNDGSRDLSRARCSIKVCCLRKSFASCADCSDFESCETVQGFFARKGYKYRKYREALDFVRGNGYEKFLEIAMRWTKQYGRLE